MLQLCFFSVKLILFFSYSGSLFFFLNNNISCKYGYRCNAKKINNISAEDLDQVIQEGVVELCSQIDWSPLVQDKESPYIDSTTPADGETDVSIMTDVYIDIKDDLPSAGIDLSNMVITLDNSMETFDITSEVVVEGDPYEFNLRWTPPLRVFDTYE